MTIVSTVSTIRSRISSLANDRRERLAARAEYAALERELATYRSTRDVADLLTRICDDESPQADVIRSILLHNQAEAHSRLTV